MVTNKEVIDAAWEVLLDEYERGASLDSLAAKHKVSRDYLTKRLKARGRFIPAAERRKRWSATNRMKAQEKNE